MGPVRRRWEVTRGNLTGTLAGDRPNAIFVAGFMGSGKSTLGRAVASRLSWQFVDLDDEIERTCGQSIPEIFEQHGEEGFRNREHSVLRDQANRAMAGSRFVIALGGGTYAYSRNRDLLRSVGPTIWLDADTDTLWSRVRRETHRPLARDREAFARLHASRRDSYSKADFRIDGSGSADEVARGIFRLGWMQDLLADA